MFTRIKSGVASKTLAIAVSIVIHTGTPAHAADVASELAGETGAISRTVSIAGLNLTLPSDQAILRHRIAVAANEVCQQAIYDDALAGIGYANCYSQVRERAWARAQLAIAAAQSPTKTASRTP